MSTSPCPKCGHPVDAQARFCGQCGHTIERGGNLGKTMVDSTPYGASMVPEPKAPPPAAKTLMQTMNDPHAAERARAMVADAIEKEATHDAETARRPAVGLNKTVMLGGETPATPPVAPEPAPTGLPITAEMTAPTPASMTPNDASPLSASVMAPGSPLGPTPAPGGGGGGGMGAAAMKTMLGMPATSLPPSIPQPAPAPAPAHAQAPAPVPAPMESAPHSQQLPPALKTMLGVAIPGIAPTNAATSHVPNPPPSQNVNKPAGTLLGVAIPGVAPTHSQPGSGRQQAAPLYAQQNSGTNLGMPAANPPPAAAARPMTLPLPAAAPRIVPAPAPLVDEPLPEAPRRPDKKGVPVMAVIGIVFLLVAIAGGAAAFFILRGGAPLTASPQLDENGRESLKIKCDSCPDGTKVSLGASSAQIAAGGAVLPLPAPLKIGENDLDVQIDRPAGGRDETVRIHVPVAYRVRADMATLASKPPAITVRVEATSGSEVTVEGKPVALDSTGRGAYAIDLSQDVDGTSDETKTVEKKIAFTIMPKGGKQEAGSLVARAAIVPLHVDSPGSILYTDKATAAVSGQTKAGAAVTIDGQTAPIDKDGRFGARVELKDIGEKSLEIVASSPPLAPRIAKSKAIRVASLDAAAKELESKGPLAYDAFAADAASKVGQAVAIDGEVVESRAQQGYTVMLVDAKKGCAGGKGACLVRVVHGEEMKAARGDTVRAYGVIEGVVSASGKQVPDIEASLLIVKGPGTK